MAGIYIHIPFCKQACYYCNFHFSTSLRYKNELITALLKEIEIQNNYLDKETVQTIYFGGGTPSLLSIEELGLLIKTIKENFLIGSNAEITIEVNPDDINEEKLIGWKNAGIDRLSVGVQSFFDEDLKWMNRAHTAEQAINSLRMAVTHFQNITIDLIYGFPLLTNEKWKQNVDSIIALGIPHLSCYALTVEQKTFLYKLIKNHQTSDIDPDKQAEQLLLLIQWLEDAGYEHYEISNFAKPNFRSRHNSSYWQGKKYLGIGPSAHSFNGKTRQWNISENNSYIDSINNRIVPFEKEELSPAQRLNEYIMTSLRTIEGLDLRKTDEATSHKLQAASKKYIESGLMRSENGHLILTKEGKLLADGIAAALFF